jgi:hypothetical protein
VVSSSLSTPGTHWITPQRRKFSALVGNRTPVVQPVCSHCAEWATAVDSNEGCVNAPLSGLQVGVAVRYSTVRFGFRSEFGSRHSHVSWLSWVFSRCDRFLPSPYVITIHDHLSISSDVWNWSSVVRTSHWNHEARPCAVLFTLIVTYCIRFILTVLFIPFCLCQLSQLITAWHTLCSLPRCLRTLRTFMIGGSWISKRESTPPPSADASELTPVCSRPANQEIHRP